MQIKGNKSQKNVSYDERLGFLYIKVWYKGRQTQIGELLSQYSMSTLYCLIFISLEPETYLTLFLVENIRLISEKQEHRQDYQDEINFLR